MGSFEHIFNIAQAFRNITTLCRTQGVIIHGSPANNWCGHGFWQFSPELFYSLYSEQNGFSKTEVFFADLTDNKNWYLVKKPENGVRSTMDSSTEVYCLVRTTKIHDVSDFVVQQSDFVRRWDGEKPPQSTSKMNSMKGFVKSHPNLLPLASSIYYRLQNITNPENLSGRNRHLTKHRVEEWLESS